MQGASALARPMATLSSTLLTASAASLPASTRACSASSRTCSRSCACASLSASEAFASHSGGASPAVALTLELTEPGAAPSRAASCAGVCASSVAAARRATARDPAAPCRLPADSRTLTDQTPFFGPDTDSSADQMTSDSMNGGPSSATRAAARPTGDSYASPATSTPHVTAVVLTEAAAAAATSRSTSATMGPTSLACKTTPPPRLLSVFSTSATSLRATVLCSSTCFATACASSASVRGVSGGGAGPAAVPLLSPTALALGAVSSFSFVIRSA
mmetsp:Transcript_64472/g.155522  ORF Transcript_64472/g.155522 Transcript_64472/m.155522 type:complete len:275 (+) Transcript_64472:485-1309(+)